MNGSLPDDLANFSMAELFRAEAENQLSALTNGLLAVESGRESAEELQSLMRAAHSLKGAARIVNLGAAVKVAHAMEDYFVAAQAGTVRPDKEAVDSMLVGVDLLTRLSLLEESDYESWEVLHQAEIDRFIARAARATSPGRTDAPAIPTVSEPGQTEFLVRVAPDPVGLADDPKLAPARKDADRSLRVTAERLNRLLGLSAEALVESRWLGPFAQSLQRLKRQHAEMAKAFESLRELLGRHSLDEAASQKLLETRKSFLQCREVLAERVAQLEHFDRRSSNLANRLHAEAVACRMRPFADGVQGFPRMVRDLSRSLGKEARLEILGANTQVDREILEKLEAPLNHLLRNALDHGIEPPHERAAAGKPPCGLIKLEARHSAGTLQISVADDGKGIDLGKLRTEVVSKRLTNAETAKALTEAELLEFLFLPGFSMKAAVTEISGRGVGLDVVQNLVKVVRGTVRVFTEPGRGARFQLQLPPALSVARTLLVEIGGEPYAFPLAHLAKTLRLPRTSINTLEGRQHFALEGRLVGLVAAHQVFETSPSKREEESVCVVVLGEKDELYGLAVDRFLGERELVVQALNPALGKIRNISAGALMEDGSPTLVVDALDVIRSVQKLASGGMLDRLKPGAGASAQQNRKRVLVVDDSLTVRELERKLLASRGYEVEVAVDGMDGWNAVRSGRFHLVVTDVDMPRLDGIELVALIKKDAKLKNLPVLIVSYKDREEDRRRGLEAGADYYLTKGSFHDESLIDAVRDLIGEAAP